jgi:hypothetical protein
MVRDELSMMPESVDYSIAALCRFSQQLPSIVDRRSSIIGHAGHAGCARP